MIVAILISVHLLADFLLNSTRTLATLALVGC